MNKKMIVTGNKIRVKDNVVSELIKLGFEKSSAESMKMFENTNQVALDVYKDGEQEYITVEFCCEIPVQCCELIEE